jgi:hypothetical protein
MMRIYWLAWGPMSPEVSTAILWHDAGEADAGDVQFGAKRRRPDLKAATDAAEAEHLSLVLDTEAQHDGGWALPKLTERERWRVKAVDLAEGYEHGLVCVARGNHLMVPVVDAYAGGLAAHVRGAPTAVPSDDVERLAAVHRTKFWRHMVAACEAARRDMG